MKATPPNECTLSDVFGSVTHITCECKITGLPNSPWDSSELYIQITMRDGYPYKPPNVQITSRIFAVNFLTCLDGFARPFHVSDIWDVEWTLCKLLKHLTTLLYTPQLTLLPSQLLDIANEWQIEVDRIRKEDSQLRQLEETIHSKQLLNSHNSKPNHFGENKIKLQSFDVSNIGDRLDESMGFSEKNELLEDNECDYHHSNSAEENTQDFADINEASGNKKETKTSSLLTGELLDLQKQREHRICEINAAINMDSIVSRALLKEMATLPNIERMHLPVIFYFIADKNRYDAMIRSYVEKFSRKSSVLGSREL